MNPPNLATVLLNLCAHNLFLPKASPQVLGPNLARPQETNPLTMMETMQSINVIVESLISLCTEIFESVRTQGKKNSHN